MIMITDAINSYHDPYDYYFETLLFTKVTYAQHPRFRGKDVLWGRHWHPWASLAIQDPT